MAQTLDAIKGGGSIKVGTTGRIGALMTRELESIKSAPQTPASSRTKALLNPVSVPCSATIPKILKPRRSLDEGSSSGGGSSSTATSGRKSLEIAQKTKSFNRKTHRIPMLSSDNISSDGTPTREKKDKKGPYVEIVDIKCGRTDRAWASPIKNQIKKLGFSKLSESIV
ncbi:uncharacterized protein LOC131145839 [Malania oleifera]|uniref:uncharacterized protein LOC131145839 n=1 Tax=Malania oleifera TaxID=397392 RepID=UPI0025ADD964|nr:uncharacterized protein LOC131145839 [Malania oleifera]